MGYGEEADRMVFVARNLLFLRICHLPLVNVESSVFFAQVIKAFSVICPSWRTVLAVKIGQFLELVATVEPNVPGNGRLVVFAEFILIAFFIVEK